MEMLKGNDFQNVAIIQETEHKGRNKNILILSYARYIINI